MANIGEVLYTPVADQLQIRILEEPEQAESFGPQHAGMVPIALAGLPSPRRGAAAYRELFQLIPELGAGVSFVSGFGARICLTSVVSVASHSR